MENKRLKEDSVILFRREWSEEFDRIRNALLNSSCNLSKIIFTKISQGGVIDILIEIEGDGKVYGYDQAGPLNKTSVLTIGELIDGSVSVLAVLYGEEADKTYQTICAKRNERR